MSDRSLFNRRQFVRVGLAGTALAALSARKLLAAENSTDGTPLQFAPKTAPDPNPLRDEFTKYPKCPYCGMDRRQWHHSRHLIHYRDDRVDGTCSLHCAAVSLSLNIDRIPKAVYVADFGAGGEPKPLVEVDDGAAYLIGSDLPGTMSRRSKMGFSSVQAAAKARRTHGGETGDFDQALEAAYLDMARDTVMVRMRRKERRRHKQKIMSAD